MNFYAKPAMSVIVVKKGVKRSLDLLCRTSRAPTWRSGMVIVVAARSDTSRSGIQS